jgi:hypothetical protein
MADWSRKFDEPIPLPNGRKPVTLKDAGEYITKLLKSEHMAPDWQAAMQALIFVARGGPTLLARIGIMPCTVPVTLGLRAGSRIQFIAEEDAARKLVRNR